MTIFFTVLGGVIVALISAITTYIVAKRRESGNIETSEAEQLWEEGKIMRLELREEIVALRSQAAELQKDLGNARTEVADLRIEAAQCKAEVIKLRKQLEKSK